MTDNEPEYRDWISRANEVAQTVLGRMLYLFSVILLLPLLLTRVVSLDGIFTGLMMVSNISFRMLPFVCFPFFAIHEGLHVVFMSLALLHPKIEFGRWIPLTFTSRNTFEAGMRLTVPDFDERTAAVHWLLILVCAAPVLGFVPVVMVIAHISNPYLLSYIVVASLWCVPSTGDRMIIAESVRGLRGR